ncbi:MAG: hypothetical protein MNPFHGCM_00009 [Gemmatimonadaceae bacterium]|nr:hypothetical protein [Gemmatimonadaceae bacterium]
MELPDFVDALRVDALQPSLGRVRLRCLGAETEDRLHPGLRRVAAKLSARKG